MRFDCYSFLKVDDVPLDRLRDFSPTVLYLHLNSRPYLLIDNYDKHNLNGNIGVDQTNSQIGCSTSE
jgi:hypothetical protein